MNLEKRLNRRRLIRISAYSLFFLVTGLIVSWFVAGALVAPSPKDVGDAPSDLRVTEFSVESDSGTTVHGWHTHADNSQGVIVLIHGLRGSRLEMLGRARLLNEIGYSTVLVDLQAHGESAGECITFGHLEKHDVRAAVQYARREHPKKPIGLIGVSLGGAAALMASPLNIDAMVLESVYTDIGDAIHNRVAARLGPLAFLPSELLRAQLAPRLGIYPSQLRPIEHITDVGCPVLIVSGTDDLHTTVSDTEAMFLRAVNAKELWLVEGAAHVDLLEHSAVQYRKRIADFFERHLRRTSD